MKKHLLILSCKHLLDKLHFIVIFIILLSISLLYHLFFIILFIYLLFLYKNRILNSLGYLIIIIYSLSLVISYEIVTNNNEARVDDICYVVDRNDNKLTILNKGKKYYLNTFSNILPGDFILVKGNIINRDNISYVGDYNKILSESSKYIYGTIDGKIIDKKYSIYTFKRIRYKILDYYKNELDEKTFDFIFALILGSNLNVESINKLNLSHILVVSGFHLNLIYTFCYFIIFKLLKKPYLSQKITLFVVTIYSLLCGLHISLLRALLMLYLNFYNEKRLLFTKLDIFSLTFLMMLIRPLHIYNTSFILSFLSSFAMMYLNEITESNNKIMNKIKGNIIIFLVLLPVITNFNNYFSLLFIFSFLFIDYFCYLLIPLSFITLLFTKLGTIFNIFLSPLLNLINELSQFAIFNIPYMNIYIKFIYYILLVLLIIMSKRKLSNILFMIILVIFSIKYYFISEEVVFIDVKQGDATLIKNEDCTYLIDCHNCFSYLGKVGIKKLDCIFISHEDYDHMSDLEKILNNIDVDFVYTSLYCKEISDICSKNRTNYKMLKVDDKLNLGSDIIKVISPIKDYKESNANSLVLEVIHNNDIFLFTGDLTKEVEYDLIKYNKLNKIDILKVAHHGSNTSSTKELLEITSPKVSIVSVSNNNKYNLPNKEILDRLRLYSNLYLTSKNGNITLKNNMFKTFK